MLGPREKFRPGHFCILETAPLKIQDINPELLVEDPKVIAERILANVEKVIVGKSSEVRLALICLLCQGHLLIEDVPGVGKTTLARSLARSTGCSFKRIQFTPDILPSDVTGVSIYNQSN